MKSRCGRLTKPSDQSFEFAAYRERIPSAQEESHEPSCDLPRTAYMQIPSWSELCANFWAERSKLRSGRTAALGEKAGFVDDRKWLTPADGGPQVADIR